MATQIELQNALHEKTPVWIFETDRDIEPFKVILANVYNSCAGADYPYDDTWPLECFYLTEVEALRAAIEAHSQRTEAAVQRIAQLKTETASVMLKQLQRDYPEAKLANVIIKDYIDSPDGITTLKVDLIYSDDADSETIHAAYRAMKEVIQYQLRTDYPDRFVYFVVMREADLTMSMDDED